MPVTFSTNYKEVFKPATIEFIDNLLDDNYALDDILQFVDEYSEEDLIDYYEEYVKQGDNLGYAVVDAFVEYHGLSCVEYCEEAYQGKYYSPEYFAQEYIQENHEVPAYVVVDWDATWTQCLSYDFDFVNGYVFSSNF